MKSIFALVALLLVPPAALPAAEASPRSVHGPLAPVLQPFVDAQLISGAVALVADKDQVLDLETVGLASIGTKTPMRAATMFWLASMTKPFTATALMMLADEGKLHVDDPVEKYLPEFRRQQVAGEKGNSHPPQHPVTIKELLTHTGALVGPNDPPIKRTNVLQEDARQYGAAPLKWEPGTKYEYNNAGINTAGRLVEVASGMPYGDFVKQRILDPLGMTDTTFWPDDEQAARLALTSRLNKQTSRLEDLPNKLDKAWLEQPRAGLHVPLIVRTYTGDALASYAKRYAWPAGGLFSTAQDVAKFCQMMLNRGASHGRRYLSEAAFDRLTTVQSGDVPVSPQQALGLGWFVKLRADEGPAVGSFGHRGARGPAMWVDPQHQLVLILMIESMDIHLRGQPPGTEQKRLCAAFFRAAINKFGKRTTPPGAKHAGL